MTAQPAGASQAPTPPAGPAPADGSSPSPAGPGSQPGQADGNAQQAGGGGEQAKTSIAEKPADDASESAADQPGRATKRNAYLRQAQQVYAGDSVGGDKIVFFLTGGEQTAPLRQLSPTLEDLARYAFVKPDEWDKYRMDFQPRSTVILRGRPGNGRLTMAIRLLQTVEAQVVYQLDPRVDIARMADQINRQKIEKGTAFLLREPMAIANLDAYVFQSLEAALKAADARLVVTVGAETPLRDDGLLRYQLDLPPAPEPRRILRSHLDYLLDEVRAERILAQADIEAILAETLTGEEATCEVAAHMAMLLSREVEPIETARIRQLMRVRGRDEFDIWFEGLDDLEVRCFAIALAVLNGQPFEDVADAARRLHDRLAEGDTIVVTDQMELHAKGRDPFYVNASRIAKALQAQMKTDDVRTVKGRIPATTIAYRNRDYPRQIIECAWQGYLIQDEILDWLGDLVTTGSEAVRVFAGTTLGHLSTYAFEHVTRRVLQPWATSESWWHREAVADALRFAASKPILQPRVMSLVNGWYAQWASPAAQSTAAIAYGTGLGLDDTARAFEALWRLAMVDDAQVHVMIARGMTTLLVDNPELLAPQMYDTVQRCQADRKRVLAGHRAFLLVANDLLTTVTLAQGEDVQWPTLLHLAKYYDHLRGPLSSLWAQVLTDGQTNNLAQRVARNWAALAEPHSEVRDAYTRMARDVQRLSPRAGIALSRMARQWNSDDELLPLPQISLSVQGVLA